MYITLVSIEQIRRKFRIGANISSVTNNKAYNGNGSSKSYLENRVNYFIAFFFFNYNTCYFLVIMSYLHSYCYQCYYYNYFIYYCYYYCYFIIIYFNSYYYWIIAYPFLSEKCRNIAIQSVIFTDPLVLQYRQYINTYSQHI
jgi:hypothetical protein